MAIIFRVFKRRLSHVCSLKPYKETRWLMPNGNPTGAYIYNCVADQKVPVILSDPHIATWYSCGPTVYDSAHIGHASCYVKLDILQRILKSFFNIKLVTAMGITDIDDKIIKKGLETKTPFTTIAKQFEHEFWLDMSSLNVEKPLIITRVSEHINSIEHFIQGLIDSGMAYVAKGSVYFDTSKFPAYGKLQKMQDSGEPSDDAKRNKMDFAVWKAFKPNEPFWDAAFGKGRPGWHIECSAMVSKIFGSQLDFHAGGIDLQFPHHENEEAQSCAYHNSRQWANYWIHVGHLWVKGDVKMSKSLKNTISIPELLKSYNADTFRMACLMSRYRYPMEYNDELMKNAETVLNKFKFFLQDVLIYVNNNDNKANGDYKDKILENLQKTEHSIFKSLQADFDTGTCINLMLNLISDTNKIIKSDTEEYYPVPVLLIAEYISNVLSKFGLKLSETQNADVSNSFIDCLVEFRHTVRLNAISRKDKELLTACDLVRDKMKSMKVQINDTNKTPSWVFTK